MTDSLTYVYCLVRSARRPSLRDTPAGMADSGAVRALDAGGGVWAIVSSVPAHEYDEGALAAGLQNLDWVGRRAMMHESVVEHFLAAPAVLPMQLFTMFTADERALQHIARDRARIDAILGRLERQLEWGLRLSFDEKAARDAVEEQHGGTSRASSRRTGAAARPETASGAAYLARKRDLLNVSRVQLVEAKAEADRLYRAMAREATDARRRTATEEAAPGSRLLLDAAFLVPARRAAGFRAALRKNARQLGAAGVVVSLTGPWPAYNFIDQPAPARRSTRKAAATASRRSTRAAAPRRKAARSGRR